MKQTSPAVGSGERDLGDLRILLSGVPGVTDRGWLGYCTVVLFPLEDGWTLFDTGHYSDRHLLLAALQRVGVGPGDIRHVILSHLHFDHVLNLPLFENAGVYVSRAETDYARRVTAKEIRDFSIPDFWPVLLEGRRVHLVDEDLRISPTKRLKVLPGHTPGCMAMFCDGPRRIAVCGDVIKNAWEAVTGKAGMVMTDEATAGASIRTVLAKGPIIVPGHDTPFIMGAGGVEFLIPFRWEIKTTLYPDIPERKVLNLERPAGVFPDRTSVEESGMKNDHDPKREEVMGADIP